MLSRKTISKQSSVSKSSLSEFSIFYKTKEEVIDYFRGHPSAFNTYQQIHEVWQQRVMDVFNGVKTIPLTYDPFFKKIFHPDVHPDRLSRLISSLLGQEVEVIQILPNEDGMLPKDSLLVMDILVRLSDGSLANVEVQRVPYHFPAERMSCYSSDLVMRQYSRVKGERGKEFLYSDLKKVYTIILYERTSKKLRTPQQAYIHYGKTIFDTGLNLELLQEYCLVALDEYRKTMYDNGRVRSERDAWLGLLAVDDMKDALKLVETYPWLAEIYREMAELLRNPEEVLNMYSEALRILDSNTVQFMIEEQREQIEEQREEISQKNQLIAEKDQEIAELKHLLKSKF